MTYYLYYTIIKLIAYLILIPIKLICAQKILRFLTIVKKVMKWNML